jgi:elongation factor 1 alpha-like protein
MSRHRVKTIGFDDDDYEEYYDDEGDEEGGDDSELTEEDREQLRLGTIEVQNMLQVLQQDNSTTGELAKIPEKEIREALWHYYYDVDKAVGYLKSKNGLLLGAPPTPCFVERNRGRCLELAQIQGAIS